MNTKIKGFTVIEMVAVIIIIVILAAAGMMFMYGGKDQASHIRCTDAAATLNSAEHALYDYNVNTVPAFPTTKSVVTPSLDPQTRIADLRSNKFLESLINYQDVILTATNGLIPMWLPAN